MLLPEGYRKALRLMKQAEKFQRPVICFVDTPVGFCGISAEERGQGEAIARNLYEMSALKPRFFQYCYRRRWKRRALALAVSDQVWMMENPCIQYFHRKVLQAFCGKTARERQRRQG